MAVINVHPDEFADIVMAYLLDMIRNEKNLPDNERFEHFLDLMEARGMKAIVYKAYLEMNTETRIKYKRIKDSIANDGSVSGRIIISKGDTRYINEEDSTFDRELCKQIFRTIKEYRFKHPSKVLNEQRVDKIIDYCIKQKEEQKNG